MLQLDSTTMAELKAATTPSGRCAVVTQALSGTITVNVYNATGSVVGSGTMSSIGVQSGNILVLGTTTAFEVLSSGTPDSATWSIVFSNVAGRWIKGSFGLHTDANAEFKWSLDAWTAGQTGAISNAYCTVAKNEILTDATDNFNVSASYVNTPPRWLSSFPTTLTLDTGQAYNFSLHAYDEEQYTLTFAKVSGNGTVTSNGIYTAPSTQQNVTLRISVSDNIAAPVEAECLITVRQATAGPTVQELEAAGYIVVTQAPYSADPTGVRDSTVGLQAAIRDGFVKFKPVYIPSGEYLVKDTLRMYHWNFPNLKKMETRSYHIQGSTVNPPTIKLATNALGFGDENDPRPILNCRAFDATTATVEADPDHPYNVPPGFEDQSGMVVTSRLHSVNVDTNNNKGAIGISWSVAQGANCAHIRVTATGSFAGIAGTTGTMGVSNIEVIGGKYGLYYPKIRGADFNSGTYVSSFKLIGQTVAAIALSDFTPEVFVGGYISLPVNVPVIKSVTSVVGTALFPTTLSTSANATPVMVDTVVESGGGTTPLFQLSNKTVYLRNVHIKGTDYLISAYEGATPITASGTWKTIDEYSRAGILPNMPGSVDGSWVTYAKDASNFPSRAIIDGVMQKPTNRQYELVTIRGTTSAPTSVTMYVTQHAHPPLPCIDKGDYEDVVVDHGAKRLEFAFLGKAVYESSQKTLPLGDYFGIDYPNNKPIDAQPAIQAAINAAAAPGGSNRVFLPRGIYYISRPIELQPHTQLFGCGSEKTIIACMPDWIPTSKTYMIVTPDYRDGTASMADLQIFVRKEIGTKTLVTALPGYSAALVTDDAVKGPTYFYSKDYFCHILWRVGRKSWSHGVDYGTEYADANWPAAYGRQFWTFTGNGGGRHWYVWMQGLNNCHADSRVILTNGTSQPLTFYGINVEMGKGVAHYYGWDPNANIEFKDSSNIRMYGSKREGNAATIWINGSTNVAMYGSGAHRILPISSKVNGVDVQGHGDMCYHLITGNSDDVMIAVATCQKTDYQITSVFQNRLMLKENITNQSTPIRVYYPEQVSLYKRGTINDSLIVHD